MVGGAIREEVGRDWGSVNEAELQEAAEGPGRGHVVPSLPPGTTAPGDPSLTARLSSPNALMHSHSKRLPARTELNVGPPPLSASAVSCAAPPPEVTQGAPGFAAHLHTEKCVVNLKL